MLRLTLRDLFWLVLVSAIVSFGFARELTRDKHIRRMEGSIDSVPTILYPTEMTREGEIFPLGWLEEGESVEVVCHDYNKTFEYTVRLKSRGEVVEKRFTVQGRSCGVKSQPLDPGGQLTISN